MAVVHIVDDDESLRRAVDSLCRSVGFETRTYGSAQEFLDGRPEDTAGCLVLDVRLPGMSGIDVCQKLRAMPQHKDTPVIFVTFHGDFQTRAQSLLSGGDDLISKPITPLELIVKATTFLLSASRPLVSQTRPRKATPAKAATANGNAKSPAPGAAGATSVDGHAKNAHQFPSSVIEKLKYLSEALTEEASRREAVEKQAAENAKRRVELEAAIAEDERSQERFGQMLEESQQQDAVAEQDKHGGKVNVSGRRRALVEVRDFVADKLVRLKRSLEEENKRHAEVERQMAENANRRAELEAALGEIATVQQSFQKELQLAENPQHLLELEASLAQSRRGSPCNFRMQKQLRSQLAKP
jgi:DNA-binding response OmpR family regulator